MLSTRDWLNRQLSVPTLSIFSPNEAGSSLVDNTTPNELVEDHSCTPYPSTTHRIQLAPLSQLTIQKPGKASRRKGKGRWSDRVRPDVKWHGSPLSSMRRMPLLLVEGSLKSYERSSRSNCIPNSQKQQVPLESAISTLTPCQPTV